MLGHSQTWITFNYVCVGVAYLMLAMSLFLMPINPVSYTHLTLPTIYSV